MMGRIELADQSLRRLPNNPTIPILVFVVIVILFVDHAELLLVLIPCFFGCWIFLACTLLTAGYMMQHHHRQLAKFGRLRGLVVKGYRTTPSIDASSFHSSSATAIWEMAIAASESEAGASRTQLEIMTYDGTLVGLCAWPGYLEQPRP